MWKLLVDALEVILDLEVLLIDLETEVLLALFNLLFHYFPQLSGPSENGEGDCTGRGRLTARLLVFHSSLHRLFLYFA